MKIAFCAPQIKPVPIVFAVNINFTNYDMQPLSVKFIDPLNYRLIATQELAHPFLRKNGGTAAKPNLVPLALGFHDGTPFICLPGIREYHQHPDHSNDPWLAHRNKGGEGTLGFIVDKLFTYGISSIEHFSVSVNFIQAGITFNSQKVAE